MKIKKYSKEESKKQKQHLEMLANIIISYTKKHNIHVLRYNAKSSESIYLKFDYGLAGTLRISAHTSKKRLHYTFNLIKGLLEPYKESVEKDENILYRYYYPENFTNNLAMDIVRYKKYRVHKYGEERYNQLKYSKEKYLKNRLNQSGGKKNKPSFWDVCVEV